MATITILRGQQSTIDISIDKIVKKEKTYSTLYIEKSKNLIIPWFGMRQILLNAKVLFGEAFFEKTIKKHPIASSIVLANKEDLLDIPLQKKRSNLYGSLESNLSQNYFIQQPLFLECRELLLEIFKQFEGYIIIPSIKQIDPGTISLIIKSFKLYKDNNIHLIIGIDQEFNDVWLNENTEQNGFSFGKNGIIWDYSSISIKSFIFSLITYGANIIDCTNTESKDIVNKKNQRIDFNIFKNQSPEISLYNKVLNDQPIEKSDVDYAYFLIKRSFQVYDFLVALNIGTLCIEKQVAFSKEQLAEIHMILGLGTHNIQFSSSQGNSDTNNYIEENNLKALDCLSTNDIKRAFVYYRLAVLYGRRQDDLDKGFEWIEKCINFSKNFKNKQGIYCYTWGYNFRAYIYSRRKEKELALQDMNWAISQIDTLRSRNPNSRDINFSYAVFNDNLSILHYHSGDYFAILGCLRKSSTIDGYQNWNIAMSATLWLLLHKIFLRTDKAIGDAKLGLEASKEVARPTHYNLYLKKLSTLNYQLGNIELCYSYIEKTLSFLKDFKDTKQYALVLAESIKYCVINQKPEFSKKLLEEYSQYKHLLPSSLIAITKAYEALHYSNIQNKEKTETSINEAIKLVAQHDDNLFNILALTIIFDACLSLKDYDLANQILNQIKVDTIDSLENTTDTDEAFVNIKVILGEFVLSQHNKVDLHLLKYIDANLPNCLDENPDSWPLLPDTIKYILTCLEKEILVKGFDFENLDKILLAASQRRDCQNSLKQILSLNPDNIEEKFSQIQNNTAESLHSFLEQHLKKEESKIFAEL